MISTGNLNITGLPVLAAANAAVLGLLAVETDAQPIPFSPQQMDLVELGRAVFFDESLSTPGNKQGCVTCHNPRRGWTFPGSDVNAGPVGNPGAAPHARGKIRPNTIAYASFVRPFQPCGFGAPPGGRWCGGMFWNGRAEGTEPLGTYPANGSTGVVSESVSWAELQLDETVYPDYYAFLDAAPPVPPDPFLDSDVYLGPLIDQALNPAQPGIEQNAGEKKVCQRVKTAKYKALYEQAFGEKINCQTKPKGNPAYHVAFMRIALGIAAFEASPYVNAFSSIRDIGLYRERDCAGDPVFAGYANAQMCTDLGGIKAAADYGQFPLAFIGLGLDDAQIRQINRGHDLFYGVESAPGPLNDGNPGDPIDGLRGAAEGPLGGGPAAFAGVGTDVGCAACHSDFPGSRSAPADDGTELRQTYNDHAFHNIGIPFNREIPNTAKGEVDGIIAHVTFGTGGGPFGTTEPGAFRTQTLRQNGTGEEPGFVKAFGHNGYFKSLAGIIHFYGTRDLKQPCEDLGIADATEAESLANNCWPAAEFPDSTSNFGNVGVSDMYPEEEAALEAYIDALSDIYIDLGP